MSDLETSTEKGNVLKTVAFEALKKASEDFSQNKCFPNDTLTSLHSLFGNTFFKAAELLENCKVVRYQTADALRQLFRLRNRDELYTIFPNINFCHCQAFKFQVIESRSAITCKHCLAVALAMITGGYKIETVTDLQYAELLKDECEDLC